MTVTSVSHQEKVDFVFNDPIFLQELRKQMLRFAQLQLSDVNLSEDVVQEAFADAYANSRHFSGKSALKTWIFGILKHKIIDALRRRYRQRNRELELIEDEIEIYDRPNAFNEKGFWQENQQPKAWGDPVLSMQNKQFWVIFELCLDKLPANQAKIFMMREFLDFETEEICQIMSISVNHLNVILYRARLGLRRCLENNWFSSTRKGNV